jgi:UDP-glucose 4-epimerase
MQILVTGGAGYIGSHACIELLAAGYQLVVFDNLSNSSVESLRRVENIAKKKIPFIEGDVRDLSCLRRVFIEYKIDAVVHFAGLKSVGESVAHPLAYYDNNVLGSVALFRVMAEFRCKSLIFSSSATVYGAPSFVPIREDFPLSTTNPYGASKLMVEGVLRDLYASDSGWSVGILRYFNPVGAHESGFIGENPSGTPNNLMPFISQVAVGRRDVLSVFGDDYDTPDGTGMRDYIHVVDLAKGHVSALNKLMSGLQCFTVNLGTGQGCSVLDLLSAFEKVCGKKIPYQIVARRSGDVAKCFADPSYALETLDWQAKYDIERMCADTWRWQSNNPQGYV